MNRKLRPAGLPRELRRAVLEELRASGVKKLQGNPLAALELVRRICGTAGSVRRGWYAHRDSAFFLDPERAA